jgi:protein phosphatase
VRLDSVARPVEPGDRLVLCSDGLFNEIADDEIGSLLLEQDTPHAAADALLELALARGGRDNVSVVVADVCA